MAIISAHGTTCSPLLSSLDAIDVGAPLESVVAAVVSLVPVSEPPPLTPPHAGSSASRAA